jgi:hypothetical protein
MQGERCPHCGREANSPLVSLKLHISSQIRRHQLQIERIEELQNREDP